MLQVPQPFLAAAFLVTSLAGAAAAQSGPLVPGEVAPPPPNVIVIVLDDVGVEKVGAYGAPGGQQAHTPTLDALAQSGLLFANAYANPVCGPTRAALMTGRHGFRTGFGANVANPGGYGLPDAEIGLGELAKTGPHPYATAAFGKWHLAVRGDEQHPVHATGFDLFVGHMSNVAGENIPGASNYYWRQVRATSTTLQSSFVQGPPWDTSTWATSVQRVALTSWLEGISGPFLAYWSPPAPHAPFQVPPHELLSADTIAGLPRGFSQPLPPPDGSQDTTDPERLRQHYDAMLEATDTEIGKLMEALAQRSDETWVFVVGDNGTPAEVLAPPFDPDHAKGSIYQQGVHVPLIVSGPGVVAPGRAIQGAVHVSDLFATVAQIVLAELPSASSHPIDGTSLLPLFADRSLTGTRRNVFCEGFAPAGLGNDGEVQPFEVRRCLTDGRFKYVYELSEDAAGASVVRERFFDLELDPFELVDLTELDFWDESRFRTFRRLRIQMNRLVNG
jgi:arylsulfatase A-like enzyme